MRFLMQPPKLMLFSCSQSYRIQTVQSKANQSVPDTPIPNKLPMGEAVGGACWVAADDSNRTWLRRKMSRKVHKTKGESGFTATEFSV